MSRREHDEYRVDFDNYGRSYRFTADDTMTVYDYDSLEPGSRIVLLRPVDGFPAGTGGVICDGEDPVHISVHGVLASIRLDGDSRDRVLIDPDFRPAD